MNFFDLGKGEEYSRKEYDAVESDLRIAENAVDYINTSKILSELNDEARRGVRRHLLRKVSDAKTKIEKLYGKGYSEAVGLNAKYDRLRIELQEAKDALAKFERENLGMHKEGEIIDKS